MIELAERIEDTGYGRLESLPDPIDIPELFSVLHTIETVEKTLADKGCYHDYDYKFIGKCGSALLDFVGTMEPTALNDEAVYGLLVLARFSGCQTSPTYNATCNLLKEREINLRSERSFVDICNYLFKPWEWEFDNISRKEVIEKIDDVIGRKKQLQRYGLKITKEERSDALFNIPSGKAIEQVPIEQYAQDLYDDLDTFVSMNVSSAYGLVMERWVAEKVTNNRDRVGELRDRTDVITVMKLLEAAYQSILIKNRLAQKLGTTSIITVSYTQYACQGVLFSGGEKGIDCKMCTDDDAFGEW